LASQNKEGEAKGYINTREQEQEAIEARYMRVHLELQLKDWVQKHDVKPE
jgi:hypothetical protein